MTKGDDLLKEAEDCLKRFSIMGFFNASTKVCIRYTQLPLRSMGRKLKPSFHFFIIMGLEIRMNYAYIYICTLRINKVFNLTLSPQNEDALDLFQKAGNQYKQAKQWSLASKAFMRAADMANALGNQYEAANLYVTSGDMLKRLDVREACTSYTLGVDMLAGMWLVS